MPIGFRYRTSTYADGGWDTYWYGRNPIGDIVSVYSSSAVKLVSYYYDAWGNTTIFYSNNGSSTTAVKNNLTYRGYYYDSDISMYYLQSRYYDSNTGRFINADSILVDSLLGYNQFAYCENNPVNKVDPTGYFANYVDFDDNYDFLDDPDLYGGSGGAYGSYLIHQHTAYTDSIIGGYYHSGMSSTYGNYNYYNVAGPWSVTDDMATLYRTHGQGYDSFQSFKNAHGKAGEDMEWHHVVEQSQIDRSGFSPEQINNTNNMLRIKKSIHRKISGYYNSKQPFTNEMTVRDWLAGKPIHQQYDFGINVVKIFSGG